MSSKCQACSYRVFVCVCLCVSMLSRVRLFDPHGLQPTSRLCSWSFPGKNTSGGCHFLLQGIFSTQGLNSHLLRLLHCQVDSFPPSLLGRSKITVLVSSFTPRYVPQENKSLCPHKTLHTNVYLHQHYLLQSKSRDNSKAHQLTNT